MDRRSFISGIGALAATLALPHAGWALDWPTEAVPHTWETFSRIINRNKPDGVFNYWYAVNAHKETKGRWYSEATRQWMPPQRAGDPYASIQIFSDKTEAVSWSMSRARNGYNPLAIVESGSTIRPPRLFAGKFGKLYGDVWNMKHLSFAEKIHPHQGPLRASWYEGQGL